MPAAGPDFNLPENRLMVRLLQSVSRLYARIYHRVDVLRPQCLPRRGAAILVCNHTSGLDPLLVQSACSRLIVWMMASEYYNVAALRRLYQAVDAIPVDRGGRDTTATRLALRALSAGRILGIFAEGRIEPTRELLPFQSGVAMLALRTGVSVYPAYLEGSQRAPTMLPAFLPPHDATLAFGPPVDVARSRDAKGELEPTTDRIRQAVESLRQLTHCRR